jgi:FkbM family methyltransferase
MIERSNYRNTLVESKELCTPLPLTERLLDGLLDQQRAVPSHDPLLQLKRVYWRWLTLKTFVADFRSHWLAPSYSQEGEDGILKRVFAGQRTGFFVDIGAHHPKRYSNTYYFYLYGWRGINVDPAPGTTQMFNQVRPRDINIEAAVANGNESLTYYEFDEPTLNGFSKEISQSRNENGPYKILNERKVQTAKLSEILDRHLPPGQKIDFLNIDVEGLDLEVLQSNDWEKYQPTIILAEDLCLTDLRHIDQSPVACLMQQHGYELYGKAVNTLIFRKIGRPLPYERNAKFE